MTADEVIRRLVSFVESEGDALPLSAGWKGEQRGACVVMTRIGCGVLARFGIKANPFPVTILAGNRELAEWVSAGCPDPQPPAAFGRGSTALAVPEAEVPEDEFRWHVVVHVPKNGSILDLDLRRLAEPTRGVAIPPAVELPWPNRSVENYWDFDSGARIWMRSEPTRTQFRDSELWKVNPVETINAIVRAIRG